MQYDILHFLRQSRSIGSAPLSSELGNDAHVMTDICRKAYYVVEVCSLMSTISLRKSVCSPIFVEKSLTSPKAESKKECDGSPVGCFVWVNVTEDDIVPSKWSVFIQTASRYSNIFGAYLFSYDPPEKEIYENASSRNMYIMHRSAWDKMVKQLLIDRTSTATERGKNRSCPMRKIIGSLKKTMVKVTKSIYNIVRTKFATIFLN